MLFLIDPYQLQRLSKIGCKKRVLNRSTSEGEISTFHRMKKKCWPSGIPHSCPTAPSIIPRSRSPNSSSVSGGFIPVRPFPSHLPQGLSKTSRLVPAYIVRSPLPSQPEQTDPSLPFPWVIEPRPPDSGRRTTL